jgi:hypothetical protein
VPYLILRESLDALCESIPAIAEYICLAVMVRDVDDVGRDGVRLASFIGYDDDLDGEAEDAPVVWNVTHDLREGLVE